MLRYSEIVNRLDSFPHRREWARMALVTAEFLSTRQQ
jgi:hypothetical protein